MTPVAAAEEIVAALPAGPASMEVVPGAAVVCRWADSRTPRGPAPPAHVTPGPGDGSLELAQDPVCDLLDVVEVRQIEHLEVDP